MSTSDNNPNKLNQACENAAPCPRPTALQAFIFQPADEQTAGRPPRPQKSAVLPEIVRLALEGHSSQSIGRRLGVPRRTVDRWLLQERQRWAETAAISSTEVFSEATARLKTAYREAMQAWRSSLADKQVTSETLGNEDDEKSKGSVRRTTQSGQAALLGKAIHAAKEIALFNSKHVEAAQQAQNTERCRAWRLLAEELDRLPKQEMREIRDLLRAADEAAPRRSPKELAEILRNLPSTDYGNLCLLLDRDDGLPALPRRPENYEDVEDEEG